MARHLVAARKEGRSKMEFEADVTLEWHPWRDERTGDTMQERYLIIRSGITIPEQLQPYVSRIMFDGNHIIYPVTRQA